MWSNKVWEDKEKDKKEQKIASDDIDGKTCEFCSIIAVDTCEKCDRSICKKHIKRIRSRDPPYSQFVCPKCRNLKFLRWGFWGVIIILLLIMGPSIIPFFNAPNP